MKKLLLAAPLAGLGLWLAWQFGTAINSSHACLMIAAKRLLAGGTMTTDFNYPNPPLCIAVYVIPVLMTKLLFIPAYYTPYLFGLLCLIASGAAIHRILRYWPEPDESGKTAVLFAFILANTLLTSSTYFYFGERDQIVGMALVPFLLVQLGLTWDYKLPRRLVWGVLIPCAVAILIKPQFALLPVLALAHRIAVRRRFFTTLRDPDFIALSGAVMFYGLLIAWLFPDYITHNLGQFVLFYLTQKNPDAPFIWLMYTAITALALGFGMTWGVPVKKMKLALMSYFAAFVCLLLFLIQMKGFYYHLIPGFVFLLIAVALQMNEIFLHRIGRRWFAAPTVIIALLAITGVLKTEKTTALRHADYMQTPLTGLVKGCAPHCSYLIFSEDAEKTMQIEIYTGATYASRFPMLWWLPGMVAGLDKNPDDPALNRLKAEYVHEVALDIQRYKPAVMAFVSSLTIEGHKNFDLVALFSADPLFRQELQDYSKGEPLHDNRKNYFREPVPEDDVPLVYEVYRRKQPPLH